MAERAALVYEDLANFPDDDLRREILDGELYVTPSPITPHQRVVRNIARALDDLARQVGGEMLFAPLDIVWNAQNVTEPDVIYIGPERLDIISRKALIGVPSLVVEVTSPSTEGVDRGKKRAVYARFGVPEYWIADPDARTIERCSDPKDGVYRTIAIFDREMDAATLELALRFDDIFT